MKWVEHMHFNWFLWLRSGASKFYTLLCFVWPQKTKQIKRRPRKSNYECVRGPNTYATICMTVTWNTKLYLLNHVFCDSSASYLSDTLGTSAALLWLVQSTLNSGHNLRIRLSSTSRGLSSSNIHSSSQFPATSTSQSQRAWNPSHTSNQSSSIIRRHPLTSNGRLARIQALRSPISHSQLIVW